MNKTVKQLLWPLVFLRRCHDAYLRKNNPEKLYCALYHRTTGNRINVDNPKTLYDKIAYLEFRTDTSDWSIMADKIAVREYVEKCGFSQYLTKLYGVWDSANDIEFDMLPHSFVIKTNHASATNVLVKDKNYADIDEIKRKLNEWLNIDYGYQICEPHYSRIKPRILAEEYLVDDCGSDKSLTDYKWYFFNGVPKFIQVMTDRIPNTHQIKVMVFDVDWQPHPEFCSSFHLQADQSMPRPASFMMMMEVAKTLAKGYPFVRIDFYEIKGNPVFGEMTFTPGFDTMNQKFFDLTGPMVVLDEK